MIDFEHVSKQYKHNAKPALEDVNFHVDDGEFVFLLGHSGAGKSTLLKLILREETPTEGRVLVNGQDVARLRRRKIPYLRRQMGIIFQDFRLIPTMTVYENIAFAMHVTNIGHKQIKERVNYMLELVHLEDKAKVYPDLLSGGEQQRVAVARALATVVRERCAHHGLPIPHVSVEPGRSIAGPSMVMLYRVGVVKDISLEDGGVRRYVAIDGGMSDNIRPVLYDAAYTATLANRDPAEASSLARCRIVGKHCESGDIIIRDIDLPADIAGGDLLAVPAVGAYGYSMASNYNMLTKPGVLSVEDGSSRWFIRPQTVDHLLALDAGLE